MKLLDPAALLDQIPRQLPSTNEDGDQASGSTIRSPHDAMAILVHVILVRLGFRLISLSDQPDNKTVESYPDNRLPPSWNASGPGSYTFRYAHEQSSMTFIVKIVSLGARLLIHATALESNRTESYEVELERFTSRHYWPWPPSDEPLVNGYISSSRLADFVFGFQAKVIQKLVPGLRKEGYEEVTDTDQGSSSSSSTANRPSSSQPARPYFPDAQPDHDDNRSFYPPGRDPLIIGDRDLDPLGGMGGRGGFGPPPLFGGGGLGRLPGGDDGGGMIVGPNHPMFRDRFQQPGASFPPGMVPPGARFDPVTPFGGPFGGPNRPGGGGPGGPLGPGARGPRRPGMGDPDWDEMPPPSGGNSDYDNMFM